ncbi:transglutaminase family protein [Flavobacterium procerum]|uniref:transglutaminase-like domain-containing protein n=1 Tax=Flavobacterium procerum TaxID=1455569 RepID=UPI0035E9F899
MIKKLQYLSSLFFLVFFTGTAQSTKQKSYISEKKDAYEIMVKNNQLSIILSSAESKWIGDKTDKSVSGNTINYIESFEKVFDINAYSISPDNKKQKVGFIGTENREIGNIFVHDMKFKYYNFLNLEEGSLTYSFYKKEFKKPQFLESYYFKDHLECKSSKIVLKVSKDVEIGYIIQGNTSNENIEFKKDTEGDFTIYTWLMLNTAKEEKEKDSPAFSYYSPHLIFYIKSFKNDSGIQNVVGNINNLYRFYSETIKDINKQDQTQVKEKTNELISGLTTDYDKTKAIFDYVQSKINYVAFEDGMGGFIPREAASVLQKKYGDCKDMANLLNEMLHYAGVESNIAWIGTRHNNYTYENVPSPIVDNHMIAVARINNKDVFLDATGSYSLFPNVTPFLQGKQALVRVDNEKYKIIPVPVIPSDQNKINGKFKIKLGSDLLIGQTNLDLNGFLKTEFMGNYKTSSDQK